MFATNREGAEVLGVRTVTDIAELPDGARRPGLRLHPGRGQPRPAAGLRGEGHPGRVRHVGRVRRGGRRRASAPQAELVALRRRARHPAGRPERAGRRVHAGQAVRPDRRPVPAGRAHRRRQPVGQLRVVVPELRDADRRRHQPGGQRRQRRRGHASPTSSTSTPTTRPPTVGLAYVEGVADGRAFFERVRAGRRPPAARAGEGRGDRRRPAGRGQPHRFAGHRRPGVRRRVPPGRRHPGRHGRGGVRGRGDVRHPAAARGTATVVRDRPPAGGAWSPPTRSPAATSS